MSLAGEIRLFAGNVAPGGWAFCHGQLVPASAAPRLFEAIGTRYGGDGATFALPDLRGRVPVHRSSTIALGTAGGAEVVELSDEQIPGHQHGLLTGGSPASGNWPARRALAGDIAAGAGDGVSLGQSTATGSGNAHLNVQPYLALNYIIALDDRPDGGAMIGEIRIFAGETAPAGWAACNGQAMEVQQFGGLYSVLGTTYGGDGRHAFGLPDLRGRVAMQAGYGPGLTVRQLAEAGGSASIDLDADQLPAHTHDLGVVATGEAGNGRGAATLTVRTSGRSGGTDSKAWPERIATEAAGGGAQHTNLQPYLALNYLIACSGRLPEPD
jgi:microcystin-dependent protein